MITEEESRERTNKLRKQFTDRTIDEMEDMTAKAVSREIIEEEYDERMKKIKEQTRIFDEKC
jgi:hypothetical protein